MKNLIGKKVRGFKFDSRDHCVWFVTLEDYIGRVGVVDEYLDMVNVCVVKYGEDCLLYPAELMEQHLIKEVDEIVSLRIVNAIIDEYFDTCDLMKIKESIRQAYIAIEAGVNAQLVEIKEERGKL